MNKGFYYLAPVMLILALGLLVLPGRKNLHELKPQQLLSEINDQTRFLTTDQVAEAIIDKDPYYVFVDVRKPGEFQEFSLEGAINIPLAEILQPNNIAELEKGNRRLVFFCNGDILSEQAWLLLRRKGMKNIFVMKGGLNRWFATIINPERPVSTSSDADFRQYNTRMAASLFFAGGGAVQPLQAISEKNAKIQVKLQSAPKKKKAEGGC